MLFCATQNCQPSIFENLISYLQLYNCWYNSLTFLKSNLFYEKIHLSSRLITIVYKHIHRLLYLQKPNNFIFILILSIQAQIYHGFEHELIWIKPNRHLQLQCCLSWNRCPWNSKFHFFKQYSELHLRVYEMFLSELNILFNKYASDLCRSPQTSIFCMLTFKR